MFAHFIRPYYIRPDTLARLDDLVAAGILEGFYLAGGTAVVLRLGHRKSEGLDFYCAAEGRMKAASRYLISNRAAILKQTGGSVTAGLEQVRVSFSVYPYPLLDATTPFRGCPVAGLKDLALMKIDDIARRGRKEDFVDLYALCQQGLSLQRLLFDDMERKFARVPFRLTHYLNALTRFDNAFHDVPDRTALLAVVEEPNAVETHGMEWLTPVDWYEVERFFRTQVTWLRQSTPSAKMDRHPKE